MIKNKDKIREKDSDNYSIIGERTYIALENLVLNSSDIQEHFKDNGLIKSHNPLSYINEFCTIRLKTARRGGHSTAISRLGLEYFENALYLTANTVMCQTLQNTFIKEVDQSPDFFVDRYTSKNVTVKENDSQSKYNYYFRSACDKEMVSKTLCSMRGCGIEALFIDVGSYVETKVPLDFISNKFIDTCWTMDKAYIIIVE